MHKYLRAIGFSNKLTKKDQEALFALVLKNPDEVATWNRQDGICLTEIKKDIAYNVGICLRGEGIPGEDFIPEYFFPYVKGTMDKAFSDMSVERHAEKESYAAVCDDIVVHTNVIFYVQNAFQYFQNSSKPSLERMYYFVKFGGLCVDGKILMPVSEDKKVVQTALSRVKTEMLQRAKNEALGSIEALAMDSYNEYQQLSKRLEAEDVYSIVDHSFIPYGVECDIYMIIGDIIKVASAENYVTKEKIWILTVQCRTFVIDICINHSDLMGEPAVGRRFKGEIWLQGDISEE